jgi:peptidoglycan/xylan/chitin deacetylase (PgdA/CDA1 family)
MCVTKRFYKFGKLGKLRKFGNRDLRFDSFATGLLMLAVVFIFLGRTVDTAYAAQTLVSLEFDDGLTSQLTAKQILDLHGMKGTFFVISGRTDSAGYLNKAQLLALQESGHEVGGHTLSHANLTNVNLTELKRQVVDDKRALESMGLKISNFAYPFGSYDDTAVGVVRDAGYKSARTVGDVGDWEGGWAESLPPDNYFATKTPDSIKNNTTLEMIKGCVTRAEQHGGGWVQIVMHDVSDSNGTYSMKPKLLSDFLDWLKPRTAQGTVVKTVAGVVDSIGEPPEPIPGNLFKNSSLEQDADGTGFPDYWQDDYYGASSAVFTRVDDAHSGDWAEKLEINSITAPADRKIASIQGDSADAPAAIAGKTYTFEVWYKSNQPVKLYGFYKAASGAWEYWAETGFQNASPGWKQVSWVTKAVPEGATALSFAIGLESVGWVVADDFNLMLNH